MKKLITKFTSILLAVVVFVSVLVVPLSASAYTYPDDYIHEFEPLTLAQKSLFFQNDVFMYNYSIVVYSPKDDKYNFYFLDKKDNPVSSFSYCDLGYHQYYLAFYNETGQLVKLNYSFVLFNSDGSYYSSSTGPPSSSIGLGYDLVGCSLDDYDQYVIYSDFPIKYRGNTIYNPIQNREIQIKDFYTWNKGGIPSGADGDVAYGPLPLVPVSVDDENIQGFINWLIENEKYKDLASYGISVNANQVNQLVSIWCSNQGNLQKMYETWKLNISGVSVITKATQLKNWLTTQYDLYKKSLVMYAPQKLPDFVLDDSSDYDEDGNFISSDTAYLKLILGTLQSFFNSFNSVSSYISSYVAAISNNIYSIANDIAIIPSQTAGYIYDNFVDPINEIIDSVKNIKIDGSTSNTTNNNTNINIDIDNIDETENNFNIAFGDLQLTLENKFSFYKQLTQITDTVQNYNYSSEAPELVFNVGSEIGLPDSDYKIDFSFYEPYREMIRKIIIAVAYISFSIGLLNKLPNIIGGI